MTDDLDPRLTPERIADRRDALGLSRTELAGIMAGATDQEIRMAKRIASIVENLRLWETGTRPPSPAYQRDLLTALELD